MGTISWYFCQILFDIYRAGAELMKIKLKLSLTKFVPWF